MLNTDETLELIPVDLAQEMMQGTISTELDPDMDNLNGLEAYETMASRSYNDMVFARTQLAFACYTILEHKLYRHRTMPVCKTCLAEGVETVVEISNPICPNHNRTEVEFVSIYRTDKSYLDELKLRVGRSVTMIKDYKQSLRLAARNFGHSTFEQVLEHGGIDTYVTIKENTVTTRNGDIVGLRNGHAPNGQKPVEFVKEKLGELTPHDAQNPSDWSYRLKDAIQPKQVRIWFGIDLKKRVTIWHKEVIENGSPSHWSSNIFDPETPPDVLELYAKRLQVQLEFPEVVEI